MSLRVGEKHRTESHFRPSREDASSNDLALWGSKDSRRDVARNASWHLSRCERIVWLAVSMSWSRRGAMRVSEASEAAANARGVHVLKDRIPRPPSLTGRAMKVRASSRARDGAGDAAARILSKELAGELSSHFQRCSKSSERRESCRCRRFCCRHCRRTNRACWWGTSKCLASRASSASFLCGDIRHKKTLSHRGPSGAAARQLHATFPLHNSSD